MQLFWRNGTPYVDTLPKLQAVMAELGEVLSRQKDGLKKIVGLDVEWKPGAKPLVATLQLSVASGYTVVIHFTQFLPRKSYKAGTRMDIPLTIATLAPLRTLKWFLEDRSITKVGVCAAGDRTRLLHSMDIDIEGILEIGNFAVTNNVLSHATMGLEDFGRFWDTNSCCNSECPNEW